jgi:hypothetical protein
MKKYLLVIAAVALVAGCASNLTTKDGSESPGMREEGIRPFSRAWLIRYNPLVAAFARYERLNPIVYVEDSQVVVDQEPIHVKPGEGVGEPVIIVWSIGDAGYSFPDKASVDVRWESGFKPKKIDCSPRGKTPYTTFVCVITRPGGKAKYVYTIKVIDANGTLYQSDPYIAND